MAASNNFRQEQRGVALRMVAALCVTILISATCLYRGGAAPTTAAERLIVTARADVFVLCWLAAAIGNVARLRFFSADDIAGSGSGTASAEVDRAKAVLQNTLEQVVLAVPVHLALAVLLASSVPLIVALAALFAIGRLLFWIGYARGAKARAFGFALTFYPNSAGLVIAVFAAVRLSL
ncbi:MAPEG family protein [Sphingomonas sp. PAMC 26605]|uniref:MAPEG family protein n=1 Tax=Sphingomonas sp. PAMC 26605 TaxID=1112214 RepID=UPI00026CB1F4|nr:MAPEG family protein [Sphingomonas sp. PAMC 26605]